MSFRGAFASLRMRTRNFVKMNMTGFAGAQLRTMVRVGQASCPYIPDVGLRLRIALVCDAVPNLPYSHAVLTLPHDLIPQHANFFDLQFDHVIMVEIPAQFETAAIADRAGADEFARHQRLVLADVFDDLLE